MEMLQLCWAAGDFSFASFAAAFLLDLDQASGCLFQVPSARLVHELG